MHVNIRYASMLLKRVNIKLSDTNFVFDGIKNKCGKYGGVTYNVPALCVVFLNTINVFFEPKKEPYQVLLACH